MVNLEESLLLSNAVVECNCGDKAVFGRNTKKEAILDTAILDLSK